MASKPNSRVAPFFFILTLIAGIVIGFLSANLFKNHAHESKEISFGLEPGTPIPKGFNLGSASELAGLLGEDSAKFYHTLFGQDSSAPSLDSAAAFHLIQNASTKNSGQAWLEYLFGRLFEKYLQFDSANVHYEAAIKAAPAFAFPYIRLGQLELKSGDLGAAKKDFKTAISLMSVNAGNYNASSAKALPTFEQPPYDFLATLFYQIGAEDSAVMALQYAQENGFKTNQLDLVEAWLWEAHGFLQKADSAYLRLVNLEPHNADYLEALNTLGWKPPSGKRNVKPQEAEAIFAVSLLDPIARQHTQNAPLWMALGQAYFRRGMYGMATESFDSSLKYDATLPSLNEKRDAAYQALIRETDKSGGAAEDVKPKKPSPSSEEQTPVIIPGTIALLGTYSVPWGSSQTQVREAYPKKQFVTLPGGNLKDTFVMDGLVHEYLLAFKNGKLWGVRVVVTDSTKNNGDIFGSIIRTKVKISGEGKGTGEASCTGFKSFQGVIWENDDTFEFMAQFLGKENQVRLVRIGHDFLPANKRLCDLVTYLDDKQWK